MLHSIFKSTFRGICLLILLPVLLVGCAAQPVIPSTNTPLPSPSATPTPTRVWFPPSQTPTPAPTLEKTPVPELSIPRGIEIFQDEFDDPTPWQLGSTTSGNIAFGTDEITLSLQVPDSFLTTYRDQPIIDNFFLELTANPNLCHGADEYGILFRAAPPASFYRFSISCDGRTRLDRIVNGSASSPQPWITSAAIPSGAPSISILGIRANGNEMEFYINNQFHFSISDPILLSGQIGLFIRSTGDNMVSVSFSDLVIYEPE